MSGSFMSGRGASMSRSRIKHALIVAGPSGAGKTAFLRALTDGRLPPQIRAHLPANAETWRNICSITQQQDWKALIANGAPPVAGVALHYDMTSMWFRHRPDFGRDPVWQILDHCDAVTLVTIRPSPERLLEQWCHAHLGNQTGWDILWKKLRAAGPAFTVKLIRMLRKPVGSDVPQRWRYPRKLRLLKRLDLRLREIRMPSTRSLNFYQGPGNIETMLHRWEQTIGARLSSRPVKRVDLTPDPNGKIGSAPAWRVIDVADWPERTEARTSGHQQRAWIGANLVTAALLGAIERGISALDQLLA